MKSVKVIGSEDAEVEVSIDEQWGAEITLALRGAGIRVMDIERATSLRDALSKSIVAARKAEREAGY
jgi:predicted Fe-Mo cluster-binding NifX family protein